MPELGNQLFAPHEVADILGVPLERVQLWIECRTLQSMETPDGTRIRRVELVPFVRPMLKPEEFQAWLEVNPEPKDVAQMKAATQGLAESLRAAASDEESRRFPLFHYTNATVALDHILADGRLRMNAPSGMNDPFESDPFWFGFMRLHARQDVGAVRRQSRRCMPSLRPRAATRGSRAVA